MCTYFACSSFARWLDWLPLVSPVSRCRNLEIGLGDGAQRGDNHQPCGLVDVAVQVEQRFHHSCRKRHRVTPPEMNRAALAISQYTIIASSGGAPRNRRGDKSEARHSRDQRDGDLVQPVHIPVALEMDFGEMQRIGSHSSNQLPGRPVCDGVNPVASPCQGADAQNRRPW